ncbi:hypothetical protein [uncultured Dubosiella sp.]|uniref:hypothetical protein n=1 Tax=uncultured Dubosiella sp. TaxID=1937011 RepID=UPI00272F23FD|nr:hypothetical protein [uncultured Dubosiella sp.]
MQRTKKLALSGGLACMMMLALSCSVFASWSSSIAVSLPPWGATVDNYSVGVMKSSDSISFGAYGVKETNSLDPHAMLINSNGESRSAWTAIRQGQTITTSSNSGLIGYTYYSRAGSNRVEPNQTQVQYQFNPY